MVKGINKTDSVEIARGLAKCLAAIACPDAGLPRDVEEMFFKGERIVWDGEDRIDRVVRT